MDITQQTSPERHLLAVMRSSADADRVRRRLIDMGVPAAAIVIDDEADITMSLRSEMRAELDDAVVMPQAAMIMPKEGGRGFLLVGVVALVISAAIAIPIAFIDYGLDYWARFLIAFAIVAVFALAFALVIGPSLGSKDHDDVAAAMRGTLLRVNESSDSIRETIIAADPIRVDAITPTNEPVSTVFTESRDIDTKAMPKIVDTAHQVADKAHKPA